MDAFVILQNYEDVWFHQTDAEEDLVWDWADSQEDAVIAYGRGELSLDGGWDDPIPADRMKRELAAYNEKILPAPPLPTALHKIMHTGCIMTSAPNEVGKTFPPESVADAYIAMRQRMTLEIGGVDIPLVKSELKKSPAGDVELWVTWESET
jgi:hypothetical protein